MLPKIPYKMSKNKRQTTSFRGINYSNVTSEGDIADSKNISARAYPYLTTRRGRERADHLISCDGEKLENITAMTTFMGELAVVADGKLYYGGKLVGELEPREKQFAPVNTKLCIMPDKKYLDMQDPYAPVLKDMGAKITGYVSFGAESDGTESESGMTDSVTLVAGLKRIAEGYGIDFVNCAASIQMSEELHNGPVAIIDSENSKSDVVFCEELGEANLTMSIYNNKWRFGVDWITKNDGVNPFTENDMLILEDGTAYIVDRVVSSISLEVRRWNGDNWYGYSKDQNTYWSPYGTGTFDHYNVRVCRAIAIPSDKQSKISTMAAFHSGFFGGILMTDSIIDNQKIRLKKKQKARLFDDVVSSVGWPSNTDLTSLSEGTQIIFKVDGYADVVATVESADEYGVVCSNPLNLVPLGEDVSHPRYQKVEILTVDDGDVPENFFESFKIGDCVTITGDVDNQKNNLSFVISDIVGNTLYASSDIFTIGTQNVTIERRIPDMDFICESGNRLWGCSNKDNTIYASALGDPTNFFVYNALSTDSFTAAVGSEGDFTACCRYGSDVLFWKETKLHKVIGSYPAEYTIYSYDIEGVQAGCEKSLTVINEVLYYKSIHGVYAFASAPTLISSNFGERYFTDAVAGSDGDSYYLSLKSDDGRSYLFVYETLLGMWILEDDVRVLDFIRDGKDLYMRTEDGNFYLCGVPDAETNMEWFVQLTPFYETLDGSKTYSRLLLRVELPRGSYLRVEVRTDGGAWREAGKIIGRSYEVVPIRIPINRCDKFELRLSGKGKCTVLSMMREFYVGGNM